MIHYKSGIKLFIMALGIASLSSIMAGCIGNEDSKNTAQNSYKAVKGSIPTTQIQQADMTNMTNDNTCFNTANSLTLCSSDNAVCASLTVCPTALYSSSTDASGTAYWVQKEFAASNGIFKLTFNHNVAPDFHLANIFNELQGNGVAGKIEQIDTSSCNSLIATGNTAGQSCNIDFMYSGVGKNSLSNNIHLVFSSSTNSQNNLDFSIKVRNNLSTSQNDPILNTTDSDLDYSIYINSITDDGSILYYPNQFNQLLLNNGLGVLSPQEGTPNITVNTGSKFLTATNLTLPNALAITTCDNTPVPTGGTCQFTFNNIGGFNTPTLDTQYARFLYSYFGKLNHIQYTHNVVTGAGDIETQNYSASVESFIGTINLVKKNYGNNYIDYNLPLKNFKLKAVIDPQFDLITSADPSNNLLNYAYGDYNGVSQQNFLKSIQFQYNQDCFGDGFDVNAESQSYDHSTCQVSIVLPNHIVTYNKLIAFQLYASYDSPTGQSINQMIGTVTLTQAASVIPNGDYTKYFHDIKLQPNLMLTAVEDSFGNIRQLDYYNVCAPNSEVSYFYDSLPNPGYGPPGPTPWYYYLTCVNLSPKLPQGSYYHTCTNISYSNGVLSADCLHNLYFEDGTLGNAQVWHFDLNYANCPAGSTVINSNVFGDEGLKCSSSATVKAGKANYLK